MSSSRNTGQSVSDQHRSEVDTGTGPGSGTCAGTSKSLLFTEAIDLDDVFHNYNKMNIKTLKWKKAFKI